MAVTANGKKAAKVTDGEWMLIKKILRLGDGDRGTIELLMAQRARAKDASSEKPSAEPAEETDLEIKNIRMRIFPMAQGIRAACLHENGARSDRRRSQLPSRFRVSAAPAKPSFLLRRDTRRSRMACIDRKVPSLAEPLAHATIGTFSEGLNATHRPKRATEDMPHYGIMFEHTGLVKVMREAILENGPKVAWVMIVDLGGYTLDFAMVGLDLQDIDARIEGTVDGVSRSAMHSEPLGVSTLDRQVKEIMDPQKKAIVFEEIESDPDQSRLESFHKIVYGRGQARSSLGTRSSGTVTSRETHRELHEEKFSRRWPVRWKVLGDPPVRTNR